MQTEALFENISKRIKQEIEQAESSIIVVVAWFTDWTLFDALVKKSEQGCKVSIITSNDWINRQSKIDYEFFKSENFKIYLFGDSQKDLIHHKFSVIDETTVISGSYNWTNKAKTNSENIVITKEDNHLAKQFINEFEKLHNYFINDEIGSHLSMDKIINRLEIIKNFILLEETEAIQNEIIKLNSFKNNKHLNRIIQSLKNKHYSIGIKQIQDFIKDHNKENVVIWIDEELVALKFELKHLEIQLNAYDNEKIELEKQLSDFQHRHSTELGDIMLELLHLRKIKFKNNREKYKEAQKDEKQYNQQVKEDKERKHFTLDDNEKKHLKIKFRKASILCHPDKVNDELKEEAEKMFIELKNAYDNNDISKVSSILESLERENLFKSKSETVTEKEKLKIAVKKISIQIAIIMENIIEIKESETYKAISTIKDWNAYFDNLKSKLHYELESLRKEVVSEHSSE